MLYSTPKQVKVIEYVILIIGTICINIRLVQASIELANTSTLASAHAPQVHTHKGAIGTIHSINSTVGEREDSIIYANNVLEASIQKYGKNTATNSSTEEPKRNLKKNRQARNAKSEHRYIIHKFNSNFKRITGLELNVYLQHHWLRINKDYWANSYQTIVDSNYFEELAHEFVIMQSLSHSPEMMAESINIIHRNNKKIINVPVLSARVHEYYLFVKEDFKNMFKTHFKLKFPGQQMDLFQKYYINDQEVAAMFLHMSKSPEIYRWHGFRDIARFNSSKDLINKIVDYSTPKTTTETLSNLKEIIDIYQVKLTKFIGGMFNEIEKFGMALPKFNVNNEYLDIASAGMPVLLDLRNSDEFTTKLTISHLKNIWKFTNKCFIYQLSDVFKFIENLSNIETSYGGLKYLKDYLHGYTDEHIREGKEYFNKIYSIIENAKIRIANVDVSNDNTYEINDEFEEIWYLVKSAMNLLNLAIMSFKDKPENLQGYTAITKNAGLSNPLQNANNDFYNAVDDDLENYVDYIWKIAKYAVEHIGLTDKEMNLDKISYNIALIQKLALSSVANYTLPTITKYMPSTTTDHIPPTTTEYMPSTTTNHIPPTTTTTEKTLLSPTTTEKTSLPSTSTDYISSTIAEDMSSTISNYIPPTTTEKTSLPPTNTIKKAAFTPTYISKAGQITFNMLLAISAAGACVLQKIFFLR
ncbi:hypothetical protein NEIRO03_1546 [Nematocida sp. AWRm78]|nr:hypothetical protein NEIRO02_1584 [Nematocida sp. AWRm79]KAI5184080.1 hypothetical protein NEIRO03_1546 [Nematocida sp. AWRm78]